MRTLIPAILAAAALAASPAVAAKEKLTPDQQLSKLLDGRVLAEHHHAAAVWIALFDQRINP